MAARDRPESRPAWVKRVERRVLSWVEGGLEPVWVVAVSGGSDSVGLLRVLHQLAPRAGLALTVAHLDHGLRGAAAEADGRFVAELAAALGLGCELGRWQPARPAHFEVESRRARYAWLAEVARNRGAAAVAVGHTQDDQAETILHRIVRGTGLRGLAGMPPRRPLSDRVTLVRPLLTTTRQDVRAYLETLGQPFREDATNADLSRTRARIRHDLIPRLEADYNPRIRESVQRLGALAGAMSEASDRLVARRARKAVIEADATAVSLRCAILRPLPPVLRAEALRSVWRQQGWPEQSMNVGRWRRLARLVGRSGDARSVSIGAGVEASCGGGVLRLRLVAVEAHFVAGDPVALAIPGSVVWGAGRIVASFDLEQPHDERVDAETLALNPDGLGALDPPCLLVRGPRPGDRFEPLGMPGQTMSLNAFLRGRHVTSSRRSEVPLVLDDRGIIWVVGHRIAHRVRQTESTGRTLALRWEPAGGAEGHPELPG